jgi:hypothetical protein
MKLAACFYAAMLVSAGTSFAQTSASRGTVRFEPKLVLGAPPTALYRQPRQGQQKRGQVHVVNHAPLKALDAPTDTEIICGMKVIRKGAEQDPGIIAKPSTQSHAAIRRFAPQVCAGSK